MAKEIVITPEPAVGASFPGDKVNGRFRMRGIISEGPKPVVGRQVEILMTHSEMEAIVNYGASALLRHPKCGITPKTDDDG